MKLITLLIIRMIRTPKSSSHQKEERSRTQDSEILSSHKEGRKDVRKVPNSEVSHQKVLNSYQKAMNSETLRVDSERNPESGLKVGWMSDFIPSNIQKMILTCCQVSSHYGLTVYYGLSITFNV